MNFYPHHISDFNNATRHLTRVERSVYRDAIERYYDSEKPLSSNFDSLAKRLLCFSSEEVDALKSVLAEFFTLSDDGYVHERCEHEIEKYRSNTSAKARAGKASAEARKSKAAQRKQPPTSVEQNPTRVQNQEPLTINQEPETSNEYIQEKDPGAVAPDYVSLFATLWDSWPSGYGEKGSRKNAESAFLKLKPDKPLVAEMLRAADAQARDKASKAASGQFFANFKHVERWIRNQEWKNEIDQFTAQPSARLSKSELATQAHRDYIAQLEREASDDGGEYLASLAGPSIGH